MVFGNNEELTEKLIESERIKLFVKVKGAEPTFLMSISLHIVSPTSLLPKSRSPAEISPVEP